jgi:hypothetical protein
MKNQVRVRILAVLAASAVLAQTAGAASPSLPERNPWLTDSVYPISHDDAAGTNSVSHAGQMVGRKLRAEDVKSGVVKFNWNPRTRAFEKAWVNREIGNTDVMVPVVSAASGMAYLANKVDGHYEYVGLDWSTGKIKARSQFPDDNRKWNTWGGITGLLESGDPLVGGIFATKQLAVGNGK